MRVLANQNNIHKGYKAVTITEFQKGAQFKHKGYGSVVISCPIPDNAQIISSGYGSLSIEHSIGSQFQLLSKGYGSVVINCDVNKPAEFEVTGIGKLHFTKSVRDDISFVGGLEYPVWFDYPPSQKVRNTIKAAQEEAVKQILNGKNYGFSSVSIGSYQLKYRFLGGFLFIRENNNPMQIYEASRFEIKNGRWYIDRRLISRNNPSVKNTPPVKKEHPFFTFLSKVDDFSEKHPFLFLLMTCGLGLLWYALKILKDSGIHSTYSSGLEDLKLTATPPKNSNNLGGYYLADVKKIISDYGYTQDSTASILKAMPKSTSKGSNTIPVPNTTQPKVQNTPSETCESETTNTFNY